MYRTLSIMPRATRASDLLICKAYGVNRAGYRISEAYEEVAGPERGHPIMFSIHLFGEVIGHPGC